MAFRASRKSASTSSTVTSPSPEPMVVEPVVPFSVEDLVGAPVTKPEPVLEEKPKVEVAPVRPPIAPPVRTDRPYVPRMNNGPRNENRGYQSFRRGGYGQHSGPSRFPPRQYGENTGGYRREWGNNNSAPTASPIPAPVHEQDINVPTETVHGILDVMPEGHGFLRPKFTPSDRDVYISQSQIRRFMLRNGDMVAGQARQPKENERYWGLLKVEKVDDKPAEEMNSRPRFEDLTPVYPNKLIRLETGQAPLSTRIIDLVAPIGFGQRGLVVSPPKAGKTTILKEIAAGISANYPNVHLMAALIGERPEEVTDLTRSIKGEVLASNFDESPAEQTRIAEVALDRAKRLVEMGKDVIVLLDSITRLARAYNLVVNPSGRTLSGGFDPAALYPAKKFLGAARCVEKQGTGDKAQVTSGADEETGGSLTVIGTALVDTGSRMDDMIYEEFKGTGNMELHLSRILQERRVFPAIDVVKSGTRHDELLLGEEAMKRVVTLRHMLSMLGDEERTMMLIERLTKTKSNAEFLDSLSKGD